MDTTGSGSGIKNIQTLGEKIVAATLNCNLSTMIRKGYDIVHVVALYSAI